MTNEELAWRSPHELSDRELQEAILISSRRTTKTLRWIRGFYIAWIILAAFSAFCAFIFAVVAAGSH